MCLSVIKACQKYFFINARKNFIKFPFSRKDYDIVIIVPYDYELPFLGQVFDSFIELKTSYNKSRSILLIWAGGYNSASCDISLIASFWNYFQSKNPDNGIDNMYLLELSFSSRKLTGSEKIKTVFQILKQVTFGYGLLYTPEPSSIPSAYKLNLLIESCRLNKTDLNLAAYTIQFYKGFMINFWLMPVSYLFGRKIRNSATPDFVFSRHCLNFWLKQSWPSCNFLQSCYLFLTLSACTSGLKINEFFLGERELDYFFSAEENYELIKNGLNLIEKYKMFIRNCSELLSCPNKIHSEIPFNIYSASDINDFLKVYDNYKSYYGKKFIFLLQKYFKTETTEIIKEYLKKIPSQQNIEEIDKSWNYILLSLIDAYISSKSPFKRKEILGILLHIFSVKMRLWADEIRLLIKLTKEKAQFDENRGCKWYGGEAGQYWHIHDIYEKKLHDNLSWLQALKSKYF